MLLLLLFVSAYLPSAATGIIRFVMESGAKGVEVVVSGKLRGARAKYMKFVDGFMIHSGEPNRVCRLPLVCPLP